MFNRVRRAGAASLVALAVVACSDATNPGQVDDVDALGAAFSATPAAFGNVESSFQGGTPDGFFGPNAREIGGPGGFGDAFAGGRDGRGARGGRGGRGARGERGGGRGQRGGPGGRGGLGGLGFGPGFGGLMGGGMHHGLGGFVGGGVPRVGDLTGCTLTNDRVVCPDATRNGVTVSRSFQFLTSAGTAQAAPDATTNAVNARFAASGTITRPNGATSTIDHQSDRTVTGLAAGSTQRTINSTASGTETTVLPTDDGTITVKHAASDKVTGVVVPVSNGTPSYPTAGTVERTMSVTITLGSESRTSTRSEKITYDGSATATIVITANGTTRTCSLPLPHGRPTCQ